MASLQIREIPTDLYEDLCQRARLEGRTPAQQAVAELRQLSQRGSNPTRLETLELLRRRRESCQPPPQLHPSPEELIREERER